MAALALAALAGGCREPDSFQPPELRPALDGAYWRLTYSANDDRAPAWSAGGDSLYYVNADFHTRFHARGIGVLLAVPTAGGAAAALVPDQLQSARTLWFSAPALAPDGRIALIEVARTNFPPVCSGTLACPLGDTSAAPPPLSELALRVRNPGAAPLTPEPDLVLQMEGRRFLGFGPPVGYETRWHPFQTVFEEERKPFFRPSWDPDGSRLVLSDGLRLLLWSPGAGAATPIPATEDGVMAAWSPDGHWIAFEHLERMDSTAQTCSYTSGSTVCNEHRIVYEIGRRTVRLIRPDGSDLRELTDGEDPAWTPDGGALYVAREDAIWRVPLDGGPGERIPHSEGGRHPAASPDGTLLAFVREASADNRDVWVVRLP